MSPDNGVKWYSREREASTLNIDLQEKGREKWTGAHCPLDFPSLVLTAERCFHLREGQGEQGVSSQGMGGSQGWSQRPDCIIAEALLMHWSALTRAVPTAELFIFIIPCGNNCDLLSMCTTMVVDGASRGNVLVSLLDKDFIALLTIFISKHKSLFVLECTQSLQRDT